MESTDEDYIKMINKTFNKIGHAYSKPKTMAFMADGETQELEEPDGTFTSMNFVWKLIMELLGKKLLLMNKQQAIRFIRVAKQRILKILNTDIDFINIHLSKDERRAFDTKTNGRFIEKLTNRIRDVEKKYNITDADLYADTPKVLQKHIKENPYVPSPDYAPNYVPSPNYVAPNNSILKKHVFEDEMNLIDTEDEEKYTEKDTPDILDNISKVKKEFLTKFNHEITMIPEQYYDKEVKVLMDELIHFYTERLSSIRKSAHFKYNPKFNPFNKSLIEVRRGKEQTRKQYYDEYKKRRHNAELNPMAFIPVEPKANVPKPRPPAPKPRTRKPKLNVTNNTKKQVVIKNVAKLNGAKLNGAKLNGVKMNGAKLNGAKKKNTSNLTVAKGLPKPRVRKVSATKKIKTNLAL